ncbi:MAG: ATP-binding protein [bacterium]|nr:ATP-binding protein [bacterium]
MFYKKFRFQVVFRVLLLVLSIYAFVLILLQSKLYATIFVVACIIIYQVYALISLMEKSNRDLSRFLQAVKHDDFSRSFSGNELGRSFNDLITAFNDVMEKLKQTRSEKEEHYRYMQTIVHHVGIGLIAFRTDGTVELLNSAAKKMLKLPALKNIKSLEKVSPPLVKSLFSLKAGQKALVKIGSDEMVLALHAAEFRLKERSFTLVSIQDIQSELQEQEMEAWQKLIRVLTHEIMNSMTPISSMTATIIDLLNPFYDKNGTVSPAAIDPETIDDIQGAMKTIHKRSLGLTHFVSAYRNLTLIPEPLFKVFPVEELFSRIENLMQNKVKENGILMEWSVEPDSLEVTADHGLLEQVLINLVLNAVDALAATRASRQLHIRMCAALDASGRVNITVSDNGQGIVKEALKKVFVPFFTTKKKGSGIGLSLSRQIMKLHKGSMHVQSTPDIETIFTLKF